LGKLVIGVIEEPNYEITQLPSLEAGILRNSRAGKHEGQGISEEDLRQVQDRAPQGRGAGDLREFETQAKTRVDCVNRLIW
jgi:hypothetical protein